MFTSFMVQSGLPLTDTVTITAPMPRTWSSGPSLTISLIELLVGVNVVNAEHSVHMWLVEPPSSIHLKREQEGLPVRYADRSESERFMSDGLLSSATAWFALLPWFGLGLALPLSFDFSLGFSSPSLSSFNFPFCFSASFAWQFSVQWLCDLWYEQYWLVQPFFVLFAWKLEATAWLVHIPDLSRMRRLTSADV